MALARNPEGHRAREEATIPQRSEEKVLDMTLNYPSKMRRKY